MRAGEITEKVHAKFNSPYDSSKEVLIFKNPSKAEADSARVRATNQELRGIIKGNVIFIWDADLMLHSEVADLLDVKPDSKFIIDDHGTYIDANEDPVDVSQNLMLKRMMRE